MKQGYVKVLAAERIRIGRCHGGLKRFKRPRVPGWRLWLACGHVGGRTAKNPPRSVKCSRCTWDEKVGSRISRDWLPGEIPDDLGVIRFG